MFLKIKLYLNILFLKEQEEVKKLENLKTIFNMINYQKIVSIIVILNILDLILTYCGLNAGYFVEGNVMLNKIYEMNPYLLIIIKMFIVILFAFIMFKYINKIRLFIKTLLFIPLIFYSYIIVLHILTLKVGLYT